MPEKLRTFFPFFQSKYLEVSAWYYRPSKQARRSDCPVLFCLFLRVFIVTVVFLGNRNKIRCNIALINGTVQLEIC